MLKQLFSLLPIAALLIPANAIAGATVTTTNPQVLRQPSAAALPELATYYAQQFCASRQIGVSFAESLLHASRQTDATIIQLYGQDSAELFQSVFANNLADAYAEAIHERCPQSL